MNTMEFLYMFYVHDTSFCFNWIEADFDLIFFVSISRESISTKVDTAEDIANTDILSVK